MSTGSFDSFCRLLQWLVCVSLLWRTESRYHLSLDLSGRGPSGAEAGISWLQPGSLSFLSALTFVAFGDHILTSVILPLLPDLAFEVTSIPNFYPWSPLVVLPDPLSESLGFTSIITEKYKMSAAIQRSRNRSG